MIMPPKHDTLRKQVQKVMTPQKSDDNVKAAVSVIHTTAHLIWLMDDIEVAVTE